MRSQVQKPPPEFELGSHSPFTMTITIQHVSLHNMVDFYPKL